MSPLQDGVAWWLANGETGMSSLTMAHWLAFGRRYKHSSHPHDPADLDRCLKLLALVPALRLELPRMREVSKQWALLIDRWEELEACHLEEVGLGWSKARKAPKTYDLMCAILYGKKDEQTADMFVGG